MPDIDLPEGSLPADCFLHPKIDKTKCFVIPPPAEDDLSLEANWPENWADLWSQKLIGMCVEHYKQVTLGLLGAGALNQQQQEKIDALPNLLLRENTTFAVEFSEKLPILTLYLDAIENDSHKQLVLSCLLEDVFFCADGYLERVKRTIKTEKALKAATVPACLEAYREELVQRAVKPFLDEDQSIHIASEIVDRASGFGLGVTSIRSLQQSFLEKLDGASDTVNAQLQEDFRDDYSPTNMALFLLDRIRRACASVGYSGYGGRKKENDGKYVQSEYETFLTIAAGFLRDNKKEDHANFEKHELLFMDDQSNVVDINWFFLFNQVMGYFVEKDYVNFQKPESNPDEQSESKLAQVYLQAATSEGNLSLHELLHCFKTFVGYDDAFDVFLWDQLELHPENKQGQQKKITADLTDSAVNFMQRQKNREESESRIQSFSQCIIKVANKTFSSYQEGEQKKLAFLLRLPLPLAKAAFENDNYQKLLEKNFFLTSRHFFLVVLALSEDHVKNLLDNSEDLLLKSYFSKKNPATGDNVLMTAVQYRPEYFTRVLDKIKNLFEADEFQNLLHEKNNAGYNSLMVAVSLGKNDLAQVLVKSDSSAFGLLEAIKGVFSRNLNLPSPHSLQNESDPHLLVKNRFKTLLGLVSILEEPLKAQLLEKDLPRIYVDFFRREIYRCSATVNYLEVLFTLPEGTEAEKAFKKAIIEALLCYREPTDFPGDNATVWGDIRRAQLNPMIPGKDKLLEWLVIPSATRDHFVYKTHLFIEPLCNFKQAREVCLHYLLNLPDIKYFRTYAIILKAEIIEGIQRLDQKSLRLVRLVGGLESEDLKAQIFQEAGLRNCYPKLLATAPNATMYYFHPGIIHPNANNELAKKNLRSLFLIDEPESWLMKHFSTHQFRKTLSFLYRTMVTPPENSDAKTVVWLSSEELETILPEETAKERLSGEHVHLYEALKTACTHYAEPVVEVEEESAEPSSEEEAVEAEETAQPQPSLAFSVFRFFSSYFRGASQNKSADVESGLLLHENRR